MLTTVILIIKQFISSITPRGVKLDFVLREICCHDFISSLEQDDETYCDDVESKMTLGWSQLWGRISDSVHTMLIHDVRVIQEPNSTSNTIFNSRKRSELAFNYRDSVIRPWVIFRQAVGDDIQYPSSIYLFEKHNEPSSHCAFFYENFEIKRKNSLCLLSA
ncbi:hypothetical protein [Aeromonas media]|uniref:hypothetical protein n=1 Tax=Aeromonas media TaxID=651 RepID=UPI003CFBECF8